MKTLLHYRASPGFRQYLQQKAQQANIDLVIVDESDTQRFASEMVDTDVLLHVLKPVTAADISAAPCLKLIQKIGVGVNTIDLDAARARKVSVANMPGTNSQAVAELTLTLMLATLRKLTYFDSLTKRGNGWAPDLHIIDQVGELHGKTVGFVGFGEIPARLAPALVALGSNVIYNARTSKECPHGQHRSLETLLETADILSLHLPLTQETRYLINEDRLARCKHGAILINTARGELVDEKALIAALDGSRLRGAGLDVFEQEPIDASSPLLGRSDVVVTPHIAWLTRETLERSLAIAMDNVRRIAEGRSLLHQIV